MGAPSNLRFNIDLCCPVCLRHTLYNLALVIKYCGKNTLSSILLYTEQSYLGSRLSSTRLPMSSDNYRRQTARARSSPLSRCATPDTPILSPSSIQPGSIFQQRLRRVVPQPSVAFVTKPCPTCAYTQAQREDVNYTNIQYDRIPSEKSPQTVFTADCRSTGKRTRRRARDRRSRWPSKHWTQSSAF